MSSSVISPALRRSLRRVVVLGVPLVKVVVGFCTRLTAAVAFGSAASAAIALAAADHT